MIYLRNMPIKKLKPFNDGKCVIYTVEKKSLKEKIGEFDFKEETVGIKSFYELHALGIKVEKVISIPFNELANQGQALKIGKNYYDIVLIQAKDTLPRSLKITLSSSIIKWNEGEEK